MSKKSEIPEMIREWFREQGRAGAKAQSARLSQKQRSERARKASAARWAKQKEGK